MTSYLQPSAQASCDCLVEVYSQERDERDYYDSRPNALLHYEWEKSRSQQGVPAASSALPPAAKPCSQVAPPPPLLLPPVRVEPDGRRRAAAASTAALLLARYMSSLQGGSHRGELGGRRHHQQHCKAHCKLAVRLHAMQCQSSLTHRSIWACKLPRVCSSCGGTTGGARAGGAAGRTGAGLAAGAADRGCPSRGWD